MTWRGWYLLACIAIIFYGITAFQLTDNIPKHDDLNDVFGFFKELTLAQTVWQQCAAFFYPNNEHITATNHLVYWLQYQLIGTLDFRSLMILGHGIIVMTGCLLGYCVNGKYRPFFFFVITLAYINLYSWDSSFKAMTALSNQSVILFSVACLLVLQRYQRIGAGIILAFLATFSQGNGMLVWPIGLVLLASDPVWRGHRKLALALWCCSALLAMLVYAWAKHTYPLPGPTATLPAILGLLQQTPLVPLTSTLAFLGSTGLATTASTLAIIVGTLCCAVIARACVHNRTAQPVLFYIAAFIVLSAVTASGLRGLIGGSADVMMESRYKMYSLAFVMIACILVTDMCRTPTGKRLSQIGALLLAMTLHVDSYREIAAIRLQTDKFRESYAHWLVDGDFKNQAIYFAPLSDYFLFIAHHLSLFDFWQLAPTGELLPLPPRSVAYSDCPTVATQSSTQRSTQPGYCAFTIHHRGNAIATQVKAQLATASTGNTLWLCDSQGAAALQFDLPDTAAGNIRWLIPEHHIPAGEYQAWITGNGFGSCAASASQPNLPSGMLIKKPRKVDEQMRELFNGSTNAPGE